MFGLTPDRKSTRLNSSHLVISYAVFCLKKKTSSLALVVESAQQVILRDVTKGLQQLRGLGQQPPGALDVGQQSPRQGAFFFNDTATTEIYTLSLHDALPI